MDSKNNTAPDSRAYTAAIARRLAWRAWWLPCIGLAVVGWGAVQLSFRYMALGFMLLLIVYPMVMTFAMLRYATIPSLAARCRANTFELQPDGTLTLSRHTACPDTGAVTVTHIETARVTAIEHSGGRIYMALGKELHQFAIVPASAVDKAVLASLEDDLIK